MNKMVKIAKGMLYRNTPIEDYQKEYGLFVKREDLSCPDPGPHFSKTRGVFAHLEKRPEKVIGVLDTYHSQAGHAVARACQILGKKVINFYPEYKHDKEMRSNQLAAKSLGASLYPLTAGRSCILYHAAKKVIAGQNGYMMPNALKLPESVEETAKECPSKLLWDTVLIASSSGTIAAGVVRGFGTRVKYLIHLGYSRSISEVNQYIRQASGVYDCDLTIIDQNYSYKDKAKPGPTPVFPCNQYYDLKAFRWWMLARSDSKYSKRKVMFWNIG